MISLSSSGKSRIISPTQKSLIESHLKKSCSPLKVAQSQGLLWTFRGEATMFGLLWIAWIPAPRTFVTLKQTQDLVMMCPCLYLKCSFSAVRFLCRPSRQNADVLSSVKPFLASPSRMRDTTSTLKRPFYMTRVTWPVNHLPTWASPQSASNLIVKLTYSSTCPTIQHDAWHMGCGAAAGSQTLKEQVTKSFLQYRANPEHNFTCLWLLR